MHTLIIGAGWAGLSAALHLAKAGNTKITLVEAAPKAGGRARSVPFGTAYVDNGQHVLMGAYQHFLSLLTILNIPEQAVLHRFPFHFYTPSHELTLPRLPKPLHVLSGLLSAKGFSLQEKIRLLSLTPYLTRTIPDRSVLEFLREHHQSASLITHFWEPLVLAALSTPIHKASTHVFLRIFKEVFNNNPHYSDWLYPTHDLNTLLPNPAIKYLKAHGHEVLFHQRITELLLDNHDTCIGAQTIHQCFKADNIILATSPKSALKLMRPIAALNPICDKMALIRYQPITTIYLECQNPVTLPYPLMGLIGGTGHWIFNRTVSNNANILSIIISGEGPHQDLNQETLIAIILKQIPLSIELIHFKIITEKEAAFSCEVGIDQLRPQNSTPVHHLYLAGDYTRTGYPSTLEGAVLSGYQAVETMVASSVLSSSLSSATPVTILPKPLTATIQSVITKQ